MPELLFANFPAVLATDSILASSEDWAEVGDTTLFTPDSYYY